MNVMMKDVLITRIMKEMMSNNKRYVKLLRPLNTLDGRDVIELEQRKCNVCNDEGCDNNDDNEVNDGK